jgi:pimeloyl-ACP methyl ester carboxylesterase
VLLTPGVHADGIDEPRLVKLARDLSAGGLTVLTPELPDLLRYQISPREPDMLEDAALWASSRPELAPDGRVGFMGISFSGGLSLVAAGRPSLAGRIAFAFSLGGHGDLSRVLAFLCTGIEPGGQHRRPHDYGVAIILLNVAGLVVPPEQVEPLRAGILTFLRASHLTSRDMRKAEEIFAEARRMQSDMPEPAATFMKYVNERDVATLGPLLLPHAKQFASDPALSPEHSPASPAPVYLLHGTEDSVIPSIESVLLARWLEPRTEVGLLLSPLISHAELDGLKDLDDVGRLVSFWARLLDA